MSATNLSREDAAVLLSEQSANDIVQPATESSVVLGTFRSVPLSKKVYRTPMLATLPEAHFVGEGSTDLPETDDTGRKPRTSMSWTDKSMTTEEIAVIVPIHENLLDDADIDLWAEIRPRVAEAFAIRLDRAVLYGEEAPASWVDANIVTKAVNAGNIVVQGSGSDLAADFNGLFAAVEDDNFDVTKVLARKTLRSQFRGLRDTTGQPLYLESVREDGRTTSIYGEPLQYLHKRALGQVTYDADGAGAGAAAPYNVNAIALDRDQYLVGIREDFTVKFLDQATINGINLAERDMVALRFKFRCAFGSFISPLDTANGEYPASVLRAA